MGSSNTLSAENIVKSMSETTKKIVINLFTEREIILLSMIFNDLSISEKKTGAMTKSCFLTFIKLPGVIGIRTFRFFCYKNKSTIDFEEFIVSIAKLKNSNSKEFMRALFEIFDTDNDGRFGLQDLITLLRTFERSGVIPQLTNLKVKNVLDSSTEGSSDSSQSDKNSNKDIEVTDNSNLVDDSILDDSVYISSKRLKKIAKNMLSEAQLNYKSPLNLEEFSSFINENVCFKHLMSRSFKKEIWSNVSYFNSIQDTAKITPIKPKAKLLCLENAISENPRKSKSFAVPFEHRNSDIFEDSDQVTMKGYLSKKGRKGGVKKRLFYIKGSLMYYFIDLNTCIPKGIMYLPGKFYK